jgi:hypothetical protein
MSKADLNEANEHLDQALEHHAAGRHASVKRRIELARTCVQRAVDAAHDPIANPTAAQGAQTSDGQSPRSFDPEIRRQQDQRRSCQIAYEIRTGVRRR